MSINIERSESGVSAGVFAALAVSLFFVNAAYPLVNPYIDDIYGIDGIEVVAGKRPAAAAADEDAGSLSLIGTFKVYNPDTIPFYIWISFENGGKLTHLRDRDIREATTIRLVDMELRYLDALKRPVVKEFPDNNAPRVRGRLGWTSPPQSDSRRRFGRKKSHVDQSGEDAASSVRRRSRGAVEIVFWQEDVQAYYEMELWGVLYAPDLKKAVVAGNYVENIKFEIEPAAR
ncbi:hypothetical protein R80B4_00034 [Fibrobacteres bacterium R8-0-B4]